LINKITGEWADEFIEGRDYVLLTGKERADFEAICEPRTDEGPGRTSQVMLLFESGIHLVLAKTDTPVAMRFRRFFAEKIMPQIARDVDPRDVRARRLASRRKTWLSPSEIADNFDISPQCIEQTITKLGLRREIKGLVRPIFEDKVLAGYLYSRKAVRQITKQLAKDGCIPRRVT
jgi:hypothetical protein